MPVDRAELERLWADLESDRVERKASLSDLDRIRQTVCAFANDLPGQGRSGVLFVGVDDQGQPSGLAITDELLRTLGGIRSEGRILPLPTLAVSKEVFGGREVAVVLVEPSLMPPVRFDGRVWIRVGPRRAVASEDEERRLTEKRVFGDVTFDQRPVRTAELRDLDLEYFRSHYLPRAVSDEVIRSNHRTPEHQLAALRFLWRDLKTPTYGGILVLGVEPLCWAPGAYVQFVRFEGADVATPVRDQQRFAGQLGEIARELCRFLPTQIEVARRAVTPMEHADFPAYPEEALRELVLNAILHRSYEGSHAPIRIFWFPDRVEIRNPGGLYGPVTPANYDHMTAYRNPVLADAMKTLGLVERFGVGIQRARRALERNGNPPPEFGFEPESVLVTVRRRPEGVK